MATLETSSVGTGPTGSANQCHRLTSHLSELRRRNAAFSFRVAGLPIKAFHLIGQNYAIRVTGNGNGNLEGIAFY